MIDAITSAIQQASCILAIVVFAVLIRFALDSYAKRQRRNRYRRSPDERDWQGNFRQWWVR